ncbi:hypothetical protein EDB89DRAFT_2062548 [Lactarius sanguifluus]|nr:hypothetical protein EDB89DRAFT_2062548 [Lactarius sanguifluus]
MAMDYLPIQAMSVPCECVFSSAKETDTARQNWISLVLMEALQLLKFALKKERLNFMDGWSTSEEAIVTFGLEVDTDGWAVDIYPQGTIYHSIYLYLNEHVARPYLHLYIVDHPSWTDLKILSTPPIGIPQGNDLHGYRGDGDELFQHPSHFHQKSAFWKDNAEDPGYVAYYTNRQGVTQLIAVEFNFENTCWTEICWDNLHNKYQVIRPAGAALRLDIPSTNVVTRDQWGTIDGQEEEPARSPTPKTPAPSPSLASNPEEIRILKDETEETALEEITKSIPTDMSQTITQETHARTALFMEPKDQGPPGGDPGDQGDNNRGGGGGQPINITHNPDHASTDKFIGKEPAVFTGDRDKAEAFLMQWRQYVGVNFAN